MTENEFHVIYALGVCDLRETPQEAIAMAQAPEGAPDAESGPGENHGSHVTFPQRRARRRFTRGDSHEALG
jgi:hypothetical protein